MWGTRITWCAGTRTGIFVLAMLLGHREVEARKPTFPVPPGEEIEVLDPNAHPEGRPAVELWPDDEGLQVDIPPAVLVHKYYYTGDRSFQAQMLPGGPVILVVNHPRTGERCYIQTNLLPGAPRVTYTAKSIEYDYGSHGITLRFGLFGHPKVTYRSGERLTARAARVVHAEQWRERAGQAGQGVRHAVGAGADVVKVMAINTQQVANTVTLPVQNLARVLPFGAAIMDRDRHVNRAERIAEHQRERAAMRAERETRQAELSTATLR